MTNKEIIQYDIDAVTPYTSIEVLEVGADSFIASFNDFACTETNVFYKYKNDKLNIKYFDDWVDIDAYILLEIMFENTLGYLGGKDNIDGATTKTTDFSPRFNDAMAKYVELTEEQQESDEGRKLFAEIMQNAPQSFKDMAFEKAQGMGLVPDASGYLDNGEAVYSLEDIAKINGISFDKALEIAKEMGVDTQMINSDDINRAN